MSLRAAAVLFLLLEGVLGGVWCALLVLRTADVESWFLPPGLGDGALRTFVVADVVVFFVLPLVTALGLHRGRRSAHTLLAFHAGGVAYAAAWGWGAGAVTGGGWLGASLMTLPAVVLLALMALLRDAPGTRADG